MTLDAGQLYTDYAPMLRGYIARRVCADDVEDVLHDVFVRVLRSRYEDRGVAGGWLCRIAGSVIIDRRRADRARAQTVPLWPTLPCREEPPEQAAERTIAREQVWAVVRAQCTKRQQRVMGLRFTYGYSTHETAARMGLSVLACNAVQHRAITTLRRVLGDMMGGDYYE